MKKYFALIFCVLLGVYVGTSCKSSDTTGKAGNTAAAKSGDTSPESAIPKATKERIEAAKAAKVDEQVTTVMMKRAESLAKTHCNCANSKAKENCEKRAKRGYDATLLKLPEDKHAEFKATYDAIVAGCQ